MILSSLNLLKKHLSQVDSKVVFPIHPRTQASMKRHGISFSSNVIAIEPVGYLEFLFLLNNCRVVLTDSGGVQRINRLEKAMHHFKAYLWLNGRPYS